MGGLKPVCSPAKMDLCEPEMKEKILELQKLSAADLDAQIKEKEAEIEKAEKFFTDFMSPRPDSLTAVTVASLSSWSFWYDFWSLSTSSVKNFSAFSISASFSLICASRSAPC